MFVRSSASHVFRAGDLVLRMAPLGTPQAGDVARSATSARTLHDLGAPVPAPVASTAGSLVEEVDGMVVTALPLVAGTTYDDDELTPDQARLWGRTLARFHATGWVHGDPEPDNLVIDGEVATFIDLDDARPDGDPVEDVAFALRAWTEPRRPCRGGVPGRLRPRGPRRPGGGRARRRGAHAGVVRGAPRLAPDPDWPDWAIRLHARIAELAAAIPRS